MDKAFNFVWFRVASLKRIHANKMNVEMILLK